MAQPTGSQHTDPKSDIDIARAATKRPILDIAEDRLGIAPEHLVPYGHDKAKLTLDYIGSLEDRPDGKLILVTAITPTPAGEGKTTTTVGLGDGLNRIGKNAVMALREPSLGPCFGVKGGAAGGGYAQVVPMEDINLHFTGDFHAIGAANNLLAAMVDNHIYWGNKAGIDPRRVSWRRVVDMNDRALRSVVSSLGGVANGFPREDGFDITVASEVMAIFCLSRNLDELRARLGNIVVGLTREREPVRASAVNADGAMTALLKDALAPNLVQTLENNPALIHGGPFANIAHGCNSVIATRAALKLADYVVTEAGFGADLGAEKFFDIKCRKAGLAPDCAVIVATIRALKMHGGIARSDLGAENLEALATGHGESGPPRRQRPELRRAGGGGDQPLLGRHRGRARAGCRRLRQDGRRGGGVRSLGHGRCGCEALAHEVVGTIEAKPSSFQPLYPDELTLWEKIESIATRIYGADGITADDKVRRQLDDLQAGGFGHFPVCMAKTQYSFSADAALKNAPSGFEVSIREVRLSGGAEFVVVICGAIMTMPGLPRVPAADNIAVDENGHITGLF